MSAEATPRADGFRMPAEWAPHQCCFMAWPARPELWGDTLAAAKADYATLARAIAAFEPVVMICRPGEAAEARDHCGTAVQFTEIEIDDSWTRDNGPLFVTNGRGDLAAVDFRFDSWGGKYLPYDKDAAMARALAGVLGVRCYQTPFVLEGGAFFVDGEGTLITTEGPALDRRRNPGVTRELFEAVVGDYLGVDKVVWLVAFPDRDTDGHIDGVAQYVRPGQVLLLVPADPANENYPHGRENITRLARSTDAAGRQLEAISFDVTGTAAAGGELVEIAYLNCYLANGAVIVPVAGSGENDERALAQLREAFPGREVVGVPGGVFSYGGGGPHCVTQQMPVGRAVPR